MPANMSYEDQLVHCREVIVKLREEVVPMRTQVRELEREKEEWRKQAEHWYEEYQKAKEELKKRKEENGELKKEIEKLTKTNRRYQVSLFDHGNFKREDIDHKEKKARGGQPGHVDTNRERAENYTSYERRRIYTRECGKCHTSIRRVTSTRQKILIDIVLNPVLVKQIIESERQWCGSCKKAVIAKDPRSLPFTEYGLNTVMIILLLRFQVNSSVGNIAKVLSILGMKISVGGVVQLLSQAKRYLRGRYEELIEEVREGHIMYNDETGWLVKGEAAWMWIMANENTTVYYAAESRGKGIMEELYGSSQAHSMHDGLASYQNTVPKQKQMYCWAHLLRFAHEEVSGESKRSIGTYVKDELVRLYQLKKTHPHLRETELKIRLEEGLNNLLTFSFRSRSAKTIQGRIRVQKDGLINALMYSPDGTNNLAERELRPVVISKKISYGSDTFSGMETTALLASVMRTTTKNYDDPIPHITDYLQQGIKRQYTHYCHTPIYDSS